MSTLTLALSSTPGQSAQQQLPASPAQLGSRARRTTCDGCRDRKAKCSRHQPTCQRCERLKIECVYPGPDISASQLNDILREMQMRLARTEASLQQRTRQCLDISGIESGGEASSLNDFSNQWKTTSPPSIVHGGGLVQLEVPMHTLDDETAEIFSSDWDMHGMSASNGEDAAILDSMHLAVLEPQHGVLSSATNQPDLPTTALPQTEIAFDLFQAFFEQASFRLPFVDSARFFTSLKQDKQATYHFNALKLAVAMTAAHAIGDSHTITERYYSSARIEVDSALRTEVEAGKPSQWDEVQALILLARYEFSAQLTTRAMLTTSRAMRLLVLLGGHAIHLDHNMRSRPIPGLTSQPRNELPEAEEMARTWWAAYALDCHCASKDEIVGMTVPITKVQTKLPQPWPPRRQYQSVTLGEYLDAPSASLLSLSSSFVVASQLTLDSIKHQQKSLDESAEAYNFCLEHDKLEKTMSAVMTSLGPPQFLANTSETHLASTIKIMLYGLRIMLHNTACLKAADMPFMESMVQRSKDICLSMAILATEVLESKDAHGLEMIGMGKLDFMLRTPLGLIAECLVETLKKSCGGIPDARVVSAMQTTTRALETSGWSQADHGELLEETRKAAASVTQSSARSSASGATLPSGPSEWGQLAWPGQLW
ncbi:hypothetical protein AMS68_001296 [Peltaster fructicola]|uniref:Zn(2)-C6 fungal-type domain-containing protein n=1 Tax=Peltaster fructicola TaxID=286661 RepID=A0A6H0XMC5_9PEZI|nr:hypothetical protein AMS68_001296 [Peltaster fructicola]